MEAKTLQFFEPQIAGSAELLPIETKTRSISISFDVPMDEKEVDDFSCLRNNPAFDFWKSEEDTY
jgi:hypothetical protein